MPAQEYRNDKGHTAYAPTNNKGQALYKIADIYNHVFIEFMDDKEAEAMNKGEMPVYEEAKLVLYTAKEKAEKRADRVIKKQEKQEAKEAAQLAEKEAHTFKRVN